MKELWLPTSTTHATVTADGNVQVWDTIEFEKRKTKQPVAITHQHDEPKTKTQ